MKTHHALLVVDMQKDFVLPTGAAAVAGAMSTVPVIQQLLAQFRNSGAPVIHIVREYRADGSDVERFRRDAFQSGKSPAIAGSPGAEIVDELRPRKGEHRILKKRFSAFMGTRLDSLLRNLGCNRIVICGTQYPNCIRATVMDAVALDYEVTLITDATSADQEETALSNIRDLAAIGVLCIKKREYLKKR